MPLTLMGYLRDVNWRGVFASEGARGCRGAFAGAVRDWRRDRDVDAISNALQNLSERQLNLIGMSHFALPGDVHRLIETVECERAYAVRPASRHVVIEGRRGSVEILPPGDAGPARPGWRADPGAIRLAA